jgi:hypothetical protein
LIFGDARVAVAQNGLAIPAFTVLVAALLIGTFFNARDVCRVFSDDPSS